MARRVLPYAASAALLLSLTGCGVFSPKPQRPAWRAQAENACFAEKRVKPSAYVKVASEIDGPGICGLTKPLKVVALQEGTVAFNTTATLDCPMTAALDRWVGEVVQPIAQARLGMKVAQINTMGSFACRGMNAQVGARLSEHSFGNALDIGGFVMEDGRSITIVRDWTRGDEQTQAFLREIHAGACDMFTTVLSPGSNAYHYNHIHVDLAMHGNTSTGPRRVCKPVPRNVTTPEPRKDGLPAAPEIDDDLDIAQLGTPPSAARMNAYHRGPVAGIPQSPVRGPDLATARPLPRNIPAYASNPKSGSIRDDGAFDPDEDDVTSRIGKRR